MCNLDTLFSINDKLIKMEGNIEALLKKVDRLFLETMENPENEWFIRLGELEYTIPKYLYNFTWNESKYPRTFPLTKIIEVMEVKMKSFESDLRNMHNCLMETKVHVSQNKPRE